jgi:hypothetical protein
MINVPTWSLAAHLPWRRAEPQLDALDDLCSCGHARAEDGNAYNEEAFRYLLGIERKRFRLSSRPYVLVLITLDDGSGQADRMHAALSAQLFRGLGAALRETDLIGWYREGHTIGAVLTHLERGRVADVSRLMAERVRETFQNLSDRIARRLQVRVYQPLERLR